MQGEFTVWNVNPSQRTSSYTIRIHTRTTHNEWPIYLVNEGGEGMSISEQDLFDMLDKHFKKEFS